MQDKQIQDLQKQLEEFKKKTNEMSKTSFSAVTSGAAPTMDQTNENELKASKELIDKLKQEISVFKMDFSKEKQELKTKLRQKTTLAQLLETRLKGVTLTFDQLEKENFALHEAKNEQQQKATTCGDEMPIATAAAAAGKQKESIAAKASDAERVKGLEMRVKQLENKQKQEKKVFELTEKRWHQEKTNLEEEIQQNRHENEKKTATNSHSNSKYRAFKERNEQCQ